MRIARRHTPPDSAFLSDLRGFYYWDSYEAPLRRGDLAMEDLYPALFAHHPRWVRWLLILRDKAVSPFGLRPAIVAGQDQVEIKSAYAIGDRIARFILYARSTTEIVTGGNDSHLDFRVSVRKLAGERRVVLSTVVSPHNFLGRAYLFTILPFHRLLVRKMLSRAALAGRI